MKCLKLLALVLAFGSPFVAFAAGGGGGHHAGPSALLYPAINFSLYFGLMWFLLAKRIAKFADTRVDEIHTLAKRGASLLASAREDLKTSQNLIANAAKDSAEVAANIDADAKAEATKLLEDATKKGERIVAQGSLIAAAEHRAAAEALRKELSRLVLERATEGCRTKLTPTIDQQLVAKQISSNMNSTINFQN